MTRSTFKPRSHGKADFARAASMACLAAALASLCGVNITVIIGAGKSLTAASGNKPGDCAISWATSAKIRNAAASGLGAS